MKLARFLLASLAAEKGVAFVVKNHHTGEVQKVEPDTECVTKIGGLCVQTRTKKHKKTKATEAEVTHQYDSVDTVEQTGDSQTIDPMLAYVMTKDPVYRNLMVMGNEDINTEGGNNPLLSVLAAKHAVTDPAFAFALTKDPIMPLATDIAADPALAVHMAVNNPRAINPQNIMLNHFIGPQSAASTYALTGSPILAHAQTTGNKLPMYMALSGQDPSQSVGYIAASIGDPLLAVSLTDDRQAMYAAATNDPTLTYTAQQMNNPAYAYAMTGDPILAMQKPKPQDGPVQPVNPMMAYFAAKQGDPNLAFALTGNAQAAYASTLADPTRAAMASTMPNSPLAQFVLTKDPVMTYEALARKFPNSPGVAYGAAMSGDPAMAMALTGDPAIGYAAQTTKPGLAAMAASSGSPGLAYFATKDPIMMAMASNDPQLTKMGAAMSGNPTLAYAVTGGDIGSMVAAQQPNPILASAVQSMGNPALTYVLTKDPAMTILSAANNGLPAPAKVETAARVPFELNFGGPNGFLPANNIMPANNGNMNMMPAIAALTKNPLLTYAMTGDPMATYAATMANPLHGVLAGQMNNPALSYMLTKDPVMLMMQKDPVTGANNMLPAIAAMTGEPMLAYAMTGDPSAAYASTLANPLHGVLASQMNNPALSYMLTKDPVLAMMGAATEQNGLLPAMAAMTGDPQLAYAMSGGNPAAAYAATMGKPLHGVLASQMNNPMAAYALTKDPVLAMMGNQMNQPVADKANMLPAMAAMTGQPLLAYAMTGDPKTMYHSTLADPLQGVMASQLGPAAGYALTGDKMMALVNSDSEDLLPKVAAMTGKPLLAYAMTGDPKTMYAAGMADPLQAVLASDLNDAGAAYVMTQDPVFAALSTDNDGDKTMLPAVAAMTKDPMMAYALSGGDPKAMYAAKLNDPLMGVIAAETGSPVATYMLTKDPVLSMLSTDTTKYTTEDNNMLPAVAAMTGNPVMAYALTGDPKAMYAATLADPIKGVLAAGLNNPAATYMLTKDPVLSMLNSDPATVQATPGLGVLAASTGNQMLTYALSGSPALAMASQHADPAMAVMATHTGNPAATYMLTKDLGLTMMTAMQGAQPAAAAQPFNPATTMLAGQMNNVTPGGAYAVTGDPNMLMTGQWANSNMALATAMANGPSPATSNPTMDLIAAHTMTDPNLAYALTGNALLSSAIANGNGKDIMGLQLGQQMNNPMMTYMMTKDPKLTYLAGQQNPLFAYTALQTSPTLAAIATQNPMMLLLNP